jgi:hypothetical protein
VADEINLDTGAALSFVAEGSSIRQQLKAAVQGKTMIMAETALREFERIVLTYGGPIEQARAARFLTRVTRVPDAPSARAQALRPTRNLEATDILILGTGDARGAVTLTTDRRAVSAARAQGVDFQVLLFISILLMGT